MNFRRRPFHQKSLALGRSEKQFETILWWSYLQFTVKCWKVDFLRSCKTKSGENSRMKFRMVRALLPDTPKPLDFNQHISFSQLLTVFPVFLVFALLARQAPARWRRLFGWLVLRHTTFLDPPWNLDEIRRNHEQILFRNSVRQKIAAPGPTKLRTIFPRTPVLPKPPQLPYGAKYFVGRIFSFSSSSPIGPLFGHPLVL